MYILLIFSNLYLARCFFFVVVVVGFQNQEHLRVSFDDIQLALIWICEVQRVFVFWTNG